MINCKDFYHALISKNINFFTGVPDSLLQDFNAYIMDNVSTTNHIITANEGGAVALTAGYYLSTKKLGLVYMQNSGQGNAINPLTSLADPDVYSIPMLLLIGWRGDSDYQDEPQHFKQGRITLSLLETLEVPYEILSNNIDNAVKSIETAVNVMNEKNTPYALVVKKGTFESYELKNKIKTKYELNREGAIILITEQLGPKDIVISTTGKASRELFEYREIHKQGHSMDFLTVGSMGHSSQLALGIALQKPNRQVYCFDGDGAAIMHLGALAIIGSIDPSPKNFKHIILNNGSHDSVGGQPTAGYKIEFTKIAKACGYKKVWRAESSQEIKEKMMTLIECEGPSLLEVRVNKGARKNLGRPTTTPIENKEAFMANLFSKS